LATLNFGELVVDAVSLLDEGEDALACSFSFSVLTLNKVVISDTGSS